MKSLTYGILLILIALLIVGLVYLDAVMDQPISAPALLKGKRVPDEKSEAPKNMPRYKMPKSDAGAQGV